ncbi:MAG TPA: hypothetical protein DCZ43_11990 [candidate division Zixibacteria bacterium]|jgi:hypothetical protein|nr:hypothetical protein [candidate division Zixibacteria bacterium]
MQDNITHLTWGICGRGEHWCDLLNLNLDSDFFKNLVGVYIIWHGGMAPLTICVGQGLIRDKLAVHRIDPKILQYKPNSLFVTWAEVAKSNCDSVEAYLVQILKPLYSDSTYHSVPVPVTMPW